MWTFHFIWSKRIRDDWQFKFFRGKFRRFYRLLIYIRIFIKIDKKHINVCVCETLSGNQRRRHFHMSVTWVEREYQKKTVKLLKRIEFVQSKCFENIRTYGTHIQSAFQILTWRRSLLILFPFIFVDLIFLRWVVSTQKKIPFSLVPLHQSM